MSFLSVLPKRARPRPGRALATVDKTAFHRGSHRHLLNKVDAVTVRAGENPDAIIVPTARPTDCLREAARLARELACPLVVLCSKSANAADAATLGREVDTHVVAIDVRAHDVPSFGTSQLMAEPRYQEFVRASDLSVKRNLGLLLARVTGWKRVLFLDDDISRARACDVRAATSLLADFHAVGLYNTGFPDNSVVCHAYRDVGGAQGTFIGGGAMLIAPGATNSFFPDIYNEDWFFLHGDAQQHKLAVTGRVWHKPFDPYADPGRAQAEEFGDCLAEGLYGLLHDDQRTRAATDTDVWLDAIVNRRKLIDHVLRALQHGTGGDRRDRMTTALEAAQRVSSYITPKLCLDFVTAWESDLELWRRHLNSFRAGLDLEKALAELGLAARYVSSR